MIKIRYSDLPAGLHVRTAVQGRHTILYLLPGLTAAQRRAALHRARSNARVGHGPRLPTAGIAFARSADRIRTTARNSLAAVRVHPALLVPAMIVVVSVAVANVLLATVSIQLRPPETAGAAGQIGVPFGTAHGNSLSGIPARGSQPATLPSPGRSAAAGSGGVGPKRGSGLHPGPSSRPQPSPSSSASPAPTAPGPSPGPSPAPSPAPSPGTSPGPAPSPSPSAAPTRRGLCEDAGPLGVCLKG